MKAKKLSNFCSKKVVAASARNRLVDYLLILAVAIIPFWRTGFNGIFNKTDLDFPLYPAEKLSSLLFTWDHSVFTGVDNILSNGLLHLPTTAVFTLLKCLGLPIGMVERIVFVSIFALCGWGMYYLIGTIVHYKDHRIIRGASLAASFFYMLNFYTFDRLYLGHFDYLFTMAITPFALALLIKGFEATSRGWKTWIRYALGVALLCSILFASNYGLIIIVAIILAAYAISRLIYTSLLSHHSTRLSSEFKFVIATGFFSLLLSAWWIIPSLHIYSAQGIVGGYTQGWKSYVSILSNGTNLLYGLCLLAPYFYTTDHFPFNPHLCEWFASPVSMGISLSLAILGISAVILKRKDPHAMFFIILLLIGWGFSAGLNSPIGSGYSLLYNLFPFFRVLRDPEIFSQITVLCLAALIGISIAEISRYFLQRNIRWGFIGRYLRPITQRTHIALSSAMLLVVLVNLYPFTSGNLQGNIAAFKPPDYYSEAREWLQQQDGDFKIFMVPQTHWLDRYSWFQNYDMIPLPLNVFPKPVIVEYLDSWPQSPESLVTAQSTYVALSDNRQSEFEAGLLLLNVKYVCLREDLLYPVSMSREPEEIDTSQIQATLSSYNSLHLEKTFGKLLFYRNDNWQPLQVYATPNAIPVNGNVDKMFEVINSDSFTPGKAVFCLSEQVSSSQSEFIQEYSVGSSSRAPEISFEKVNATKYEVKVTNATEPFFLVFSESYHPQWKAYVNSQGGETNWMEAFFQKSIPSESHFIANGYANAWYVDPGKLGTGAEFSVTLYFQPQSSFYLGWIISGLTFAGCIGLLVWGWRRGRRLKARD